MGRDHTLYSLVDGVVVFSQQPMGPKLAPYVALDRPFLARCRLSLSTQPPRPLPAISPPQTQVCQCSLGNAGESLCAGSNSVASRPVVMIVN